MLATKMHPASTIHHPQRQNVTTSIIGFKKKKQKKKTVTYPQISPKMVNLRDMTGNTEEEKVEVAVFVTKLC